MRVHTWGCSRDQGTCDRRPRWLHSSQRAVKAAGHVCIYNQWQTAFISRRRNWGKPCMLKLQVENHLSFFSLQSFIATSNAIVRPKTKSLQGEQRGICQTNVKGHWSFYFNLTFRWPPNTSQLYQPEQLGIITDHNSKADMLGHFLNRLWSGYCQWETEIK